MLKTLTESDQTIVFHYRDHGTPPETRRAQIVLMNLDGASTSDIAAAVSLSTAQVRYWLRAWDSQGVGIFPSIETKEKPDIQNLTEPETIEVETEVAAESVTLRPGIDAPRLPLELRESVGMLPDDPMAEAGRKVLLYQFERMLLNEPGSRLGEDIEAVHDMRVATRRMRSAIRLFEPFFKPGALDPFRRALSRTARSLGEVRDLDVALEKAQKFANKHGVNLDPVFDAWNAEHEADQRALIEELDSKRFRQFVKHFHAFLITPGKGAQPLNLENTVAYQVRHIAPRLIYEHYEQVRAYETVLDGAPLDTLHALRIDFKRLRYTLEFFEEVLGPEAKPVIKEIKGMQDHLGDLHDAVVVADVLRDFLDEHNTAYSGVPVFMRPDMSGVLAYATAKQAELDHLLTTFPEAWASFTRDEVRRNLALAVAVL